jgi:hypothetical protein
MPSYPKVNLRQVYWRSSNTCWMCVFCLLRSRVRSREGGKVELREKRRLLRSHLTMVIVARAPSPVKLSFCHSERSKPCAKRKAYAVEEYLFLIPYSLFLILYSFDNASGRGNLDPHLLLAGCPISRRFCERWALTRPWKARLPAVPPTSQDSCPCRKAQRRTPDESSGVPDKKGRDRSRALSVLIHLNDLVSYSIQKRPQFPRARWMTQLTQRFGFDLADTLASHGK